MYLVTGGFNVDDRYLTSTQIMLNSAWSEVGELPSPRRGFRAVSVDNSIIVTGKIILLRNYRSCHNFV